MHAGLLHPASLCNSHVIIQRRFKLSNVKRLFQIASNIRSNKITRNSLEVIFRNHDRHQIGDCPPQLFQQGSTVRIGKMIFNENYTVIRFLRKYKGLTSSGATIKGIPSPF